MANENITVTVSGGSISIGNLTEVFTNQVRQTSRKLTDFYYGGNIVRRNECTNFLMQYSRPARWRFNGIPQNGSIRLGQFWGKGYYYAPQSNINADSRNFYSTGDAEQQGMKTRSLAPAFFTLVNNTTRLANSTGEYAYRINQENGFRDSTVVFYNYAEIKGRGGNGGNGNGGGGFNGGPALRMNAPSFFRNFSNSWGGGRGGNAGGSSSGTYNECYCCNSTRWSAGGNGGGGGAGAGAGGAGGNAPGGNFNCNGNNGFGGNWSSAGGQVGARCCGARAPKGSVCSNLGQGGGGWGNGVGVMTPSNKFFTRINDGNIAGGFAADGVNLGGMWG